MQTVSSGDNLHEISDLFNGKINERFFKISHADFFLPRELSVKQRLKQHDVLLQITVFTLSTRTDRPEQTVQTQIRRCDMRRLISVYTVRQSITKTYLYNFDPL